VKRKENGYDVVDKAIAVFSAWGILGSGFVFSGMLAGRWLRLGCGLSSTGSPVVLVTWCDSGALRDGRSRWCVV